MKLLRLDYDENRCWCTYQIGNVYYVFCIPFSLAVIEGGEVRLRKQKRARELLEVYESLGPQGRFGAYVIKIALDRAEQAAISGDPVKILQSYEELKGLE